MTFISITIRLNRWKTTSPEELIEMADLLEEFEELIRTPGVSGFEDDIRKLITDKIMAFGKPRTDDMGNLILTFGDSKKNTKHVVLIAHMDELGLLVTNIHKDGSMSFRKMGGIDDRTLVSRVVNIRTRKGIVTGIIGLKPPHLMEDRSEMKKTVPAKDLRIDVGTRSKKETEALGV
jgi:putative aminopeptidase FrvX